jgi:phosphate starvation-inducible protein PhoH and related proteins
MAGVKKKNLSKDDIEKVNDYVSSNSAKGHLDMLEKLEKNFTPNKKQQEFVDCIKNNTVTICSGSAGTGKTLSAIYSGLKEILTSKQKLILVRPIFESATQKVGFLPGELEDKLAPHIKPFMFVLEELIGYDESKDLIHNRKVIFELLNYMRGATFKNSIIICDEAQNMTVEEMILALTRIGKNSKIIFVGDFYQSDIRQAKGSILEFTNLIKEVKGVKDFHFSSEDVMRNPILVQITELWEKYKIDKNI